MLAGSCRVRRQPLRTLRRPGHRRRRGAQPSRDDCSPAVSGVPGPPGLPGARDPDTGAARRLGWHHVGPAPAGATPDCQLSANLGKSAASRPSEPLRIRSIDRRRLSRRCQRRDGRPLRRGHGCRRYRAATLIRDAWWSVSRSLVVHTRSLRVRPVTADFAASSYPAGRRLTRVKESVSLLLIARHRAPHRDTGGSAPIRADRPAFRAHISCTDLVNPARRHPRDARVGRAGQHRRVYR